MTRGIMLSARLLMLKGSFAMRAHRLFISSFLVVCSAALFAGCGGRSSQGTPSSGGTGGVGGPGGGGAPSSEAGAGGMTMGGTGAGGSLDNPPGANEYRMKFPLPPKATPTLGDRDEVTFTLDLSSRYKEYNPPADYPGIGDFAPNVSTGKVLPELCDLSSDAGIISLAKSTMTSPPPGDMARVDHLELVMGPLYATVVDGKDPELESSGTSLGICFAYRNADGTWDLRLTPQKSTWDSSKQRYHLTLDVKQGPVDGFRILAVGGQMRYIEEIVIVTEPGDEATPLTP